MISAGTTGITSRCSTVPCSRSRMSAAPVSMTVIMVRLLMICITEVNQLDFKFGLNFARVTTLTGTPIQSFASRDELRHIVDDDVLDVGHAIEGLGSRGGIDIDLNGRLPPGENIRLELWGNLNDVNEALRIHRRVDFRRCDLHRRLERGRREAVRNAA